MIITQIKKRDGRIVPFDKDKIYKAINNAIIAVGGSNSEGAVKSTCDVIKVLALRFKNSDEIPTVEQIQDIVEEVLIKNGYDQIAKQYILYRHARSTVREKNMELMKTFKDLTFKDAIDNDLKRENANINTDTAMGTMLKYGSESSKAFSKLYVLKTAHSQAHENGDIHIHDLDFYMLTETCCQIGLRKLLKGGFHTGHGYLREPNSIQTAAQLTAIAIQSNQNDQHGGQSIPDFEYGLAPYVAKSYTKEILSLMKDMIWIDERTMDREFESEFKSKLMKFYEENGTLLDKNGDDFVTDCIYHNDRGYKLKISPEDFLVRVYEKLNNDVYQAMEALIHNLNTLHCFHPDQEVCALDIKTYRDFRNMSQIEKDAFGKLLDKLYNEDKLLMKEICEQLGISRRILDRIFNYYGIVKRNKIENSESRANYNVKTIGVRNCMQLESVQQKSMKTQRENHNGKLAFNTPQKDQTCLEKYGCVNPMQNEIVKQHCINSNKRNHDGVHNLASEEFKNQMLKKYGRRAYPALKYMARDGAHRSKTEVEIYDKLVNDFPRFEILNNVRSLIPENWRYELDIYIPEINFGIEVNGGYGHNKDLYLNDLAKGITKSKEIKKEILFREQGIDVIQIWEDDWNSNPNQVYDYIISQILIRGGMFND